MSHRLGVSDGYGRSVPGAMASASQMPSNIQKRTFKITASAHRISTASTVSSARQSTASHDSLAQMSRGRPSGIPRSTSATSQARLSVLAASRPIPSHLVRVKSPTAISPSEMQQQDWMRSAETKLQPSVRQREPDTKSRRSRMISLGDADAEHNSILGIALPSQTNPSATVLPSRLIPELQALAGSSYRPEYVTQSTDTISSPSTIYSGSPSPWSASTTATTPISWSSASPSILQTSYSPVSSRRSHTVPVPTVTRLKTPKLPAVQERSSVASLNARKVPQDEQMSTPASRKSKKTPLCSPAPTPPPRSSSFRKTRSRSNSNTEDQRLVQDDTIPPMPVLAQSEEFQSQHNFRDPFLDKSYAESPVAVTQQWSLQEILRAGPDITSIDRPYTGDRNQAVLVKRQGEAAHSRRDTPSAASAEPHTPTFARSRLARFSRLAMFGRTGKSVSANEPNTETRKVLRKGPQAGTGHEGYRKYSKRGRSASIDGSNAASDSESSFVSTTRNFMRSASRKNSSNSSRHSRTSQSELDDFASTRLKPVAMLGGSRSSMSEVRDSYTHIVNLASAAGTDLNNSPPRPQTKFPPTVSKSQLITNAITNGSPEKPTLAQRRSRRSAMPETFPQLDRIATDNIPTQPYIKNWNTSQSSVAPSTVVMTDIGSDAYDTDVVEKQRKKSRKYKWNIFKKRDDDDYNVRVQQRIIDRVNQPQLQVTVAAAPAEKSIPYYALLDSEGEANTAETLERYLDEASRMVDIETVEASNGSRTDQISDGYSDHRRSVLLPSAPLFDRNVLPSKAASSQKNQFDQGLATGSELTNQDARQPRLAQVGRIPKVVAGHAFRQPSRMSFSRPFQLAPVIDPRTSPHESTYHDLATKGSVSETLTQPAPKRPTLTISSNFYADSSAHPNVAYATDAARYLVHDAFKLADRESTTSSSSDGMISIIGPPLLPFLDSASKPLHSTQAEDDVWKEYDDLIDHVTSPVSPDNSPNKFRDEILATHVTRHRLNDSFEMPAKTLQSIQKELEVDRSYETVPMIYAAPEISLDADFDHETRLRRSRIVSALHSSTAPSSPFSIGDYAGDGAPNSPKSDPESNRVSSSTSINPNTPSPRGSSVPEALVILPPTPRHENSLHIDEVRRSRNPAKHSEMSYASLMVSRWLSFGRVLFSPGHLEVQRQPERHVLVIDGLGNDDWSIYCAVTYQTEQAYVHDLKETGHERTTLPRTNADNVPPNLRRREVTSLYDPLKYPDNFFSVVVLRFPPAMADSKLRRLISECHRVLMPGGYMELMLLDLDIVNMGVLTRRALRRLKTKMSIADPGVSLRPVLDSFQSVLGDAGFAKLSKCMVGVPVVGKPPEALDSPVSSRSSGGSDIYRFNPSAGPQPLDGLHGRNNYNLSLNDLVADHSENADAKISKVVSRTGRSWWQHCFEAAVINDGNLTQSIFADKQVLRECKTRASSFKLLIAYTQKPTKPAMELKRRTMSEPAVATLASA